MGYKNLFLDILTDTVLDTVKLVPFLFLTYLAMEYLENKAGEKTAAMLLNAVKGGPVIGGILGVFPQCGFSAAASGLYSGGVITAGTLIAVFLSTSDEMLPILISERAPVKTIFLILGAKIVTGAAAGIASGAVTVLVWDYIPLASGQTLGAATGLYSLAVGFAVSIAAIVAVSLLTKAPSDEMIREFEDVSKKKVE